MDIKTPHSVIANHSHEEDAASEISNGNEVGDNWRLVTTEAGMSYYWNEENGETSWEPPNSQAKSASALTPLETPITDISSPTPRKMSMISDAASTVFLI